MSTVRFRRVSIVGLGTMGGSLARALRALPKPPAIVAHALSEEDLQQALSSGTIDRATATSDDAVAVAELVVYAVPIGAALELIARHAQVLQPTALVMDLSSLQSPMAEKAAELGLSERVVGAHPMAGAEGSGFAVSRAGMYGGAKVWLSGGADNDDFRARFSSFWEALDANPEWTDAAAHDDRMVRVSHLPQLLANVLARSLDDAGYKPADLGPGGTDMTRLAGSSPDMWRNLIARAAPRLGPALREVSVGLDSVAALLEAGDADGVAHLMARTRKWKTGA
jgi:prephenate dehydrogenase